MTVTKLIITDGRWDYLKRTVDSAATNVRYPFDDAVIVNDSGLAFPFDDWNAYRIINNPHRLGLAGAIQAGWDVCDTDYIFHLEDDFLFNQPVDLTDLIGLLEDDPLLAQVCFKRNAAPVPWEQMFGGFIEANPDRYDDSPGYTVHRECFSFNPCVYPRRITDGGAGLESDVTERLLAAGYHFGIWGKKFDDPIVHHIGDVRSHGWKL